MKNSRNKDSRGFALLELLMVFVILGALASIAIPHYAGYKDRARAAQCLANRRHIEMDEQAHFLEHDSPGLTVSGVYSCPSGGIYLWLISDPNDPDYPRIGCSIHYAGIETPAPDKPEEIKEKKPKKPKKKK